VFNAEVDMDNPEFKFGMVLSCMKELRDAVKTYNIRQRVKLEKIINEATRIDVVWAKVSVKIDAHGF
jgi:hypothetical protein